MAKRYNLWILVLIGLVAQAAQAESGPGAMWARYSGIAERHPFGIAPPEPPPSAVPLGPQPTPEELNFAQNMHVAYIRRSARDGELRVGIVDDRTKTSGILCVGDSSPDLNVTLVSASYEEAKALVRRGAIEKEIFAGPAPSSSSSATAIRPIVPGGGIRTGISYAERARRRQEAMQRIREEAEQQPKLTVDELTKHLQDYQMELIRSGGEKGPPLPLPLTPEMDDQLVKEGVLPALE